MSYFSWDSRVLRGSLVINGEVVFGSVRPLALSKEVGPRSYRTAARTHVLQSLARGGDEPLDLEPLELSVSFSLLEEADAQIVARAAASEEPVGVWAAWWVLDRWSVPLANTAQTEWRTSRRPPWGLPTVTRALYQPRAWLDGVEQQVLSTGTPTAGQIVVPDAPTDPRFTRITTPDLTGATRLDLWYPIEVYALIRPSWSVDQPGGLRFAAEISEQLAGTYTPRATA